MTHIESAHCPCGPTSEVVWPDGLRERVQDAIDHAGSEVDPTNPDEGVTPELLFHALAEAGVRLEAVR